MSENKKFFADQIVWAFVGEMTQNEVKKKTYYNKKKMKILAVSEDQNFALFEHMGRFVRTALLYTSEAEIDEVISKMNIAKTGDLVGCLAKETTWKRKFSFCVVSKVNKISISVINPVTGKNCVIKNTDYVLVSKKNVTPPV